MTGARNVSPSPPSAEVSPPLRDHPDQRGRWIPWIFVAAFAVVVVANAFLVYFAVTTHSGVTTPQAYERGLAYNTYLAEAEAQKAHGLTGRVALEKGVLRFSFKGKGGVPLRQAEVRAQVVRPAQGGLDFDVALQEVAPGRYEAQPSFPRPGLWNVRIFATWQTIPYRLNTDILAP